MPAKTPAPVRPTGTPEQYECDACGAQRNTAGGTPVGWSRLHGGIWCGECTALDIPSRRTERASAKRRAA